MSRACLLLTLSFLVVGPCVAEEPEVPVIPGTEVPVLDIVSGLPWAFVVSGIDDVSDEAAPADDPGAITKLLLRTEEPIRTTPDAAVHLELSLESLSFPGDEQARAAFDAAFDGADPDTGLSYAWDALMVVGDRLHRLHAGCTLSSENFDTAVEALAEAVAGEAGPGRVVRCRCGGGCEMRE